MSITPLPTPGPSDVWGEDLNEGIETRFNSTVKGVDVGPGLYVDNTDPAYPKIFRSEISPLSKYRFRGEWNLNESLLYTQDFNSSTTLPGEVVLSYSNNFKSTRVNMDSLTGTSNRPPFTYAWAFAPNAWTDWAALSFVNANSTAFTGKFATKVKFWWAVEGTTGTTVWYGLDGTETVMTPSLTWASVTVSGQWFSSFIWRNQQTSSSRYNMYLTGIEVYGVNVNNAYKMGDLITYSGHLYQCLQDNTIEIPSSGSSTWKEIPFSYAPGGPYQTYIDTRVATIGSRVDDPADILWAGSNGYDVEFTEDDLTGTLPSGWSWVNQGTSAYSQQFGKGIVLGDSSTSTLNCAVRDFPTETTWTATTKISQTSGPVNWNRVGLVLQSSSSGKTTYFGLTQGASSPWSSRVVTVSDWTNPTTFSGGELTSIELKAARYLRIKKNSSTYDFQYSVDGISWMTLSSGRSAFDTYDKIGLATSRDASGGAGVFDWFRVR